MKEAANCGGLCHSKTRAFFHGTSAALFGPIVALS